MLINELLTHNWTFFLKTLLAFVFLQGQMTWTKPSRLTPEILSKNHMRASPFLLQLHHTRTLCPDPGPGPGPRSWFSVSCFCLGQRAPCLSPLHHSLELILVRENLVRVKERHMTNSPVKVISSWKDRFEDILELIKFVMSNFQQLHRNTNNIRCCPFMPGLFPYSFGDLPWSDVPNAFACLYLDSSSLKSSWSSSWSYFSSLSPFLCWVDLGGFPWLPLCSCSCYRQSKMTHEGKKK